MARTGKERFRQRAERADERIWLGVCLRLAEMGGVRAVVVRALFVFLGLLLWPFAVIGYLLLYTGMRLGGQIDAPGGARHVTILKSAGLTAAVAIVLHTGAWAVLRAALFLFIKYSAHTQVELGRWGWFLVHDRTLLVWALLFTVPFALLAAMPLRHDWDKTLRTISQALLAVYALVLCFGIASVLVGILGQLVEDFTQGRYAL